MSRDLYKSRRMYESPMFLVLMIPLGVILIFFLANFAYVKYFQHKLTEDCTEVFAATLDRKGLTTETQMQNYIIEKLVDKGYDKEEIKVNIIFKDEENTLLIVYAKYYSILDSLINRQTKMTSIKLRGYYDSYKETVIEVYDEEIDDDLDTLGDKIED